MASGAKITRRGVPANYWTRQAIWLIKALPEKHARGAAKQASELAPRSTPETNPRSAEPGYVHLADAIKAKETKPGRWEVIVDKYYGLFVEMGTIFMEAIPFFRPAIASAQRAMRREFRASIQAARRR